MNDEDQPVAMEISPQELLARYGIVVLERDRLREQLAVADALLQAAQEQLAKHAADEAAEDQLPHLRARGLTAELGEQRQTVK